MSISNAEEMQFIVDELFVGNRSSSRTGSKPPTAIAVDLRNIRSPIVVFCSKGDNITPPQQALGWILDLYENVDEIRANEPDDRLYNSRKRGHLGIFVSGRRRKKRARRVLQQYRPDRPFAPRTLGSDVHAKADAAVNPDLVSGDWIMRCEERTLADIRALGGHEPENDRVFATVAQLSSANLALYRTFAQPFVRAMVNPAMGDWMRRLHPLSVQYEMWSDENPFAGIVKELARVVRENRQPMDAGNPFIKAQEAVSHQITEALDSWGKLHNLVAESIFFSIFGSPVVQAMAGIDPKSEQPLREAPKSSLQRWLIQQRVAELKSRIREGELPEAAIRGLLYAGSARGSVDERGFNALRRMRRSGQTPRLTLAQFKEMAREQFYMLLLDQEATLEAIPGMLPADMNKRRKLFNTIKEILSASGQLEGECLNRLRRVERLFGLEGQITAVQGNGADAVHAAAS